MPRTMGSTMHRALYSHQCCHLEVLSMVDHLVIEASQLVQGKTCLLVATSVTIIARQKFKTKYSLLNRIQMTDSIIYTGACNLVHMRSFYAEYTHIVHLVNVNCRCYACYDF